MMGDGIERGDDDYIAGKFEERGYPGMVVSSMAANNTRGHHICDWCLNPYNPVHVHDCYEKRNGIKLSDQKELGIPMYKPHKFEPTQTGLIGAPCAVCGGLPTAHCHTDRILADGRTPEDHRGDGCSVDPDKVLEMVNEPAVWLERIKNDAVTYEIRNIPNEQAMRVLSVVLPKALELYLKKSRDYGGNVMQQIDLGPKACIPDMQRKFGKLVNAIWWDQPLKFEQPEEILMDLLGHIFIILDEMRTDKHADVLYRIEEEE